MTDEAEQEAEPCQDSGAAREMPKYVCHKEVHALKIEQLFTSKHGDIIMVPAEEGFATLFLVPDFFFGEGFLLKVVVETIHHVLDFCVLGENLLTTHKSTTIYEIVIDFLHQTQTISFWYELECE